jgi:hypothetical protein
MRRTSKALLAALAAGGMSLAAACPAMAATARPADSYITVTNTVTGTTYLKGLDQTVSIGSGTLTSTIDLTTDGVSSTMSLPPTTASFKEFGFIPVSATTEFVQDGPQTGTVNLSGGTITTTSQDTLKITNISVGGISIPLGNSCQTKTPASITLASQAGFSLTGGGELAGSYTIPKFAHCGLATPLINLIIAGPGNTLTIDLGPAQF